MTILVLGGLLWCAVSVLALGVTTALCRAGSEEDVARRRQPAHDHHRWADADSRPRHQLVEQVPPALSHRSEGVRLCRLRGPGPEALA